MTVRPVLLTIPRDDQAFAEYARRCLDGDDVRLDPIRLQAALRRFHTRASVYRKAETRPFGNEEIWYVYRDGRAVLRDDPEWWTREDAAWVAFDDTGRFTAANDRACALVELGPGELVGRRYTDLIPEHGRPAWVWEILAATGSARSTFDHPLRDGARRIIEYRIETVGEGRYESRWRELVTLDAEQVARFVGDGKG